MDNIIEDKTLAFANRIVNLYKFLVTEKGEYIISKQIMRSGTSVGANVAEAQEAQSRNDFCSKMSIALKETNETKYWLKVLLNGEYITNEQFNSVFDDACELHKIISSIILSTKDSTN